MEPRMKAKTTKPAKAAAKVKPLTDPQMRFISRAVVVPPNPVMIAKPLDPTKQQPAAVATDFLFTGKDPVQTGVAPGTIEPARAAVLRGRVLSRDEVPLAGVNYRSNRVPGS